MIKLTRDQFQNLEFSFPPERPGPLIGQHILQTGNGCAFADTWPDAHGLVLEVAGNYSLLGNPDRFSAGDLQANLKGFLDAQEGFEPLIYSAFPDVFVWKRIIYSLANFPNVHIPSGVRVQTLTSANLPDLQLMDTSLAWISKTWGGFSGLAASTKAWGAFVGGKLVSVACPFFVGKQYEDIGVVTDTGYRNRGLSTACAGELCRQILHSGKQVSWSTSLFNLASQRVAQKLGFKFARFDRLFLIGIDPPE